MFRSTQPFVNTATQAVWRSAELLPGWTISVHTPDLSSMSFLGDAAAAAATAAQPAASAAGQPLRVEANPFSKSFGDAAAKSSKSTSAAAAAAAAGPKRAAGLPSTAEAQIADRVAAEAAAMILAPHFSGAGSAAGGAAAMAEDDDEAGGAGTDTPRTRKKQRQDSRKRAGTAAAAAAAARSSRQQSANGNGHAAAAAAAGGGGGGGDGGVVLATLPADMPPELAPVVVPPRKEHKPRKVTRKRCPSPTDDMSPDELRKAKRRERNRKAAAQCRMKKINREDELRDELEQRHKRHAELFKTFQALTQELATVQREAIRHHSAGCSISASITLQDMQQ